MAGELENDFGIQEVRDGKLISPYKNGDWSEDFTTLKSHFQEAITDIKSWFKEDWEPVAYMVSPLPHPRFEVALGTTYPPTIARGLLKRTDYLDLPETLSTIGTNYRRGVTRSTSGGITLDFTLYPQRIGPFLRSEDLLNRNTNRIAFNEVGVSLFEFHERKPTGAIFLHSGVYIPSRLMVSVALFDPLARQLESIQRLEAEKGQLEARIAEVQAAQGGLIERLRNIPVIY